MSEVTSLNYKHMTIINNIKNIGKLTTLTSFILGTILLILFVLFKTNYNIVEIGIYYVVIAFIVNIFVFVGILISGLYFWNHRLQLFATCGLLLVNLPIAFGYFLLTLYLIYF